jgi:2-dehydro-3-deoxyphosphogluconate aldolase/(4S)-4-hydroxy-2-oxoglutarate aldolase
VKYELAGEFKRATRDQIAQVIVSAKLLAIVRLPNSNHVQKSIECLISGGVKVLEITSNTMDFCAHIGFSRNKYPNQLIGAGTIVNEQLAKQAIDAGSQFLVTPNVNEAVVELAHKYNIPVLMGALTPTEVSQAVSYGADIVKLFPAVPMGLDYFSALRGPFSQIPMFAVGGINQGNAAHWLSSGIQGIGVGGELAKEITSDAEMHTHMKFVQAFIASLKI